MSFISGRPVKTPEFEIVSNPTIRLDDIRHRRFLQPRACPVCRLGQFWGTKDMEAHISGLDDAEHAAYEVLES